MNFNKNKRNKKTEKENSRFSELKTESNPFKSQNRSNSRNRSNSNSDGSYVPPSKRNNKQRGKRNDREGNSFKGRRKRYTGVAPPVKEKEPPKIMPNINDKELFPSLAVKNIEIEESNPWSKKLVVNSENDNNEEPVVNDIEEKEATKDTEKIDDIEDNETEDNSWSTIIKRQDPKVKEDDPDFIKPGWVRLSYDKTLKRYVQEHGAEVPESSFYRELRLARMRKFQEEWEKRMQEYEEYDEFMGYTNNYYYSWQADEIDAERELEARIAKMEEEWEQEDNASDDGVDSEDYEDYEYY